METMEQKTKRNARVQLRYDELMREGKHGHYETMFRVVREEVERERERCPLIYSAEQAQIEAPLRAEITRQIALVVDLRTVLEGAVDRCERQTGGYVGCDGQYIKVMRCAVQRAYGIGA